VAAGTALPTEPAGADHGSWETVVAVPDPLVAGAPVRLIQDDGDTAWYGDGRTSKDSLPADLQKSLGQVLTYQPGTAHATTTALAAQPAAPLVGQQVTYTATVSGPAGAPGTPTGTVDFAMRSGGRTVTLTCGTAGSVPLVSGSAQCAVDSRTFGGPGTYTVSADYHGSNGYAASAGSLLLRVGPQAAVVTVTAPHSVKSGQAALISVKVSPSDLLSLLLGGRVTVTVTDAAGRHVPCVGLLLPGVGGFCAVPAGQLRADAGPYRITAAFAGNARLGPGTGSATLTVTGRK